MKKLVMLLLCTGLLVACSSSNYSVKVSDGSSTLISGEGIEVTKQDYFEQLLDSYGSSKVLNDVLTVIADKEITNQKDIDSLLKEREETYTKYANGDLDSYAKSMGYKSKDEYIKEALLPDVKQELLRNKYIKENLDHLLSEYQVVRFKKIIVSKESTALAIISNSKDEKSFNEQMKKYSDKAEDAGIVTKNSSLDENLTKKLETLSKIDKDGVYSDSIALTDNTFAVLYIYDTKREKKDEYINALTSDQGLQTDIESIYLKKYNFKVNDSKIKDAIKQISSEYIE